MTSSDGEAHQIHNHPTLTSEHSASLKSSMSGQGSEGFAMSNFLDTNRRGIVGLRMVGVELNERERRALQCAVNTVRDWRDSEHDGRQIDVFALRFRGEPNRYVVCVSGQPVSVGVETSFVRFFRLRRFLRDPLMRETVSGVAIAVGIASFTVSFAWLVNTIFN